MKDRLLLLIVLIFCCLSLTVISVQAAKPSNILSQATSTRTPTPFFHTATPIYNWNLPTNSTPTQTPNFATQTLLAQNTLLAGSQTPTITIATPTETLFLTNTAVVLTPSPTLETLELTSMPAIVGESRTLIKSDRYDKYNYLAIPFGFLVFCALIAAGIFFRSKHR